MKSVTVPEKYKELIQYISQLGASTRKDYDLNSVVIKVFDSSNKETLRVKLTQPLTNIEDENYHYLTLYWLIPPGGNYFHYNKFHESTDKSVIFNTLLFEITNWKLQNIDRRIACAINKALSSETITSWLENKERDIRKDERQNIINHLSIEELRELLNKELSNIKVSLKIEG